MKIRTRIQIFRNNPWRIFFNLNKKRISHIIPDSIMLRILFRAKMGGKLNLKNPKTFNEKIQWLKLHEHYPEYVQLVDKYEVREIIKKTIGEQYLVPLLGVWNNVDDIDFELLPEQFVLKCTHDSGSVIICTDKSQFDSNAAKEKLRKALQRNFFWLYREWPYKNVRPRIVAEKYLMDSSNNASSLTDYKVLCFEGEPKVLKCHSDRFSNHHTADFYDTNWDNMHIVQGSKNSEQELVKPNCLDELLLCSRKLAKGFKHVRVDWYCADGVLYFGEITLYHGSGFEKFEAESNDLLFGSWINL